MITIVKARNFREETITTKRTDLRKAPMEGGAQNKRAPPFPPPRSFLCGFLFIAFGIVRENARCAGRRTRSTCRNAGVLEPLACRRIADAFQQANGCDELAHSDVTISFATCEQNYVNVTPQPPVCSNACEMCGGRVRRGKNAFVRFRRPIIAHPPFSRKSLEPHSKASLSSPRSRYSWQHTSALALVIPATSRSPSQTSQILVNVARTVVVDRRNKKRGDFVSFSPPAAFCHSRMFLDALFGDTGYHSRPPRCLSFRRVSNP